MPRKRVLVLTADAGFGHRRAAEAVRVALEELYGDDCAIVVENPLHAADVPDIVRRLVEENYDDMVMDDATLYRIAYYAMDAPVVSDLVEALGTTLLNEAMYHLLLQHEPNVVVSTYPAFAQPVSNAVERTGRDIALAVVITDLTDVHSLWYSPAATMHFVPTNHIRQQAISKGIPATHIRVTGLPVHPAFARETRDKHTLRKTLGWENDKLTALIVGSNRVRQIESITRLLDRSGLGLQLSIIAGGDYDLFETLQTLQWLGSAHLYNRVNNMPELMKASDFVISKAGGLVVSETLACGLPMLISEALPGQEAGNARYVVDNGAGVWATEPVQIVATVLSWLHEKADPTLDEFRANAEKLGKPRAAYDIAEAVWGLG